MKAMNNAVWCLYFQRKPNTLGDDLENDFETPIAFKAKRETLTKRTATIGGMVASATATYFDTYDLPLLSSEIKKDDVVMIGTKRDNQKVWRVQSVELIDTVFAVMPKDEQDFERKCLKRIEVM